MKERKYGKILKWGECLILCGGWGGRLRLTIYFKLKGSHGQKFRVGQSLLFFEYPLNEGSSVFALY